MSNHAKKRIADNPFYVLELSPDCSRMEVEREGHKILGMLSLGLSGADSYRTPLGTMDRTSDNVRVAMAELRDPDKRLGHELWARGGVGDVTYEAAPPEVESTAQPPWHDAWQASGFKR